MTARLYYEEWLKQLNLNETVCIFEVKCFNNIFVILTSNYLATRNYIHSECQIEIIICYYLQDIYSAMECIVGLIELVTLLVPLSYFLLCNYIILYLIIIS